MKQDKTFAGRLRVPTTLSRGGTFEDFTYDVKGKLGKNGKATGTIDANLKIEDTGARGSTSGHCYSGVLHWKTKRGAHVTLSDSRQMKEVQR